MPERALAHAADAPADDLRKIRVIEGCERNAAALRHAPCAPGRMKSITDLDEVRLECVQKRRPAARIQWQAVIESARQGHARYGADAPALNVFALAGDHHGVLPGRMRP
jgi:hypothetical protein